MSYLVLARKWRPQAFEDVTGQEHVVRTLANAIEKDRVAHAFLLCGPRGVGKTTTARLLARALNCVHGPTAKPCGVCAPCTEIAAGTSVDVAEIDGASNNGVDAVRELREVARYLPQRDRYKIFIIDEVHMLSVQAFNALLKTLEEPPPHVKFIFATTDPQKLPETILSRVQRHNFRRIPLSRMVERLRRIGEDEKITISDRALGLIARQAEGGMRDALSLLDQLLSASADGDIPDSAVEDALGLVDAGVVRTLAGALIDRDGQAVLQVVADVYDRGFEPRRLCEELCEHLRDLVVARATGKAPPDRADSDQKALVDQAAKADVAQLTRLFDLVQTAAREVGLAAQPRLALEVALLNGVHMAPSQGLAELAAKLESLASGLGPASPAPRAPAPATTPAPRPPEPSGDIVRQVEAMAQKRAAPRQTGARPTAPPPPAEDDEPHGDEEPPPPADIDGPVFTVDTSPGGCATGECIGDDPSLNAADRFRLATVAVKARAERAGLVLAESRLLYIRPGEVGVGFTAGQKFHRAQLESTRAAVEEVLAVHFRAPTRLRIEDAPEGSPASQADESRRAREDKVKKLRDDARQSEAVRTVQSVLGGEIDDIEVLEER